ncbi:MAG: winged helix-turn-helix domain-containing protein [Bacteriovorax sp.]|nr:winged helix-turn-helix domain-containing protein [Bacteriovorax sp.]
MVTTLDFGGSETLSEGHPALGLFQDDTKKEDLAITSSDIGRSYYQLGKVYYDKADLDKAEEAFVKALSFAEPIRDGFSILKTYGFLIRLASEKLEDTKAQKYILESEKLMDALSRALPTLTSEFFYNLGVVKNYGGNFEAAKSNFELAYKKSTEENEPELLSKCLLSLATNAFYRKDFDLSLRYLDQLNDLLKIIKKFYLSGAMYNYYAKIFIELNENEKALNYYKLANEYLQSKKCWNLYGYILFGKATALKKAGNFDEALNMFHLAQESIDVAVFKRLNHLIEAEIDDVNDSTVDLYLDRTNRKIVERSLGTIDFKHRFVLLEILFLLSKNSGTYFDKEQLAKMIWKDEYNPLIHDKLIYTSVSRLRKLIEPTDSDSKRKYIIRGKDGYTFNPLAKIRFHMEVKTNSERSIGNVDLSSPV